MVLVSIAICLSGWAKPAGIEARRGSMSSHSLTAEKLVVHLKNESNVISRRIPHHQHCRGDALVRKYIGVHIGQPTYFDSQ